MLEERKQQEDTNGGILTLEEFITKWNGKPVDTDFQYGAQCMDLMHQYCVEVLHLGQEELTAPFAKEVFNNFDNMVGKEYFDRIPNTPDGVPTEGDIVLWGSGTYGHVAIFYEGNESSFRSFDQNYPTGTPCHVQDHTYSNVLGWLHFKAIMQIDQKVFNDLIKKLDLQTKLLEELNSTIVGLNSRIRTFEDFQKQIASILGIENQPNIIIGDIVTLREVETKKDKTEKENSNLKIDIEELKKDKERLTGQLNDAKQIHQGVLDTLKSLKKQKASNDASWNSCEIKLNNLIEQGVGELVKTIKIAGFIIQIFKPK